MPFEERPEPRQINGVTLLGPDLFAKDDDGNPASPIASVFPRYKILVTGRGIHAVQALAMADFLKTVFPASETPGTIEKEVFRDAVALLVKDPMVIIRSVPGAMDRMFSADEVLQRLLPKERIQFTGSHLAEVRRKMRSRGESWRISPPPRSVEEIIRQIRSSRVHVATGACYYHSAHTGARFLTYEEFMRIRPLLFEDREEALARLKEIVHLMQLENSEGTSELSFFLPAEKDLDACAMETLVPALESAATPEERSEAEGLFSRFAGAFAEACGPDLALDGENSPVWRTTMFCHLYDISEKTVEEYALGLSPEFHLNVRWLRGARILEGRPFFEPDVQPRVRDLIDHYCRKWPGITSINVGGVESPLTTRDKWGEEREVYLVVVGLADGSEDIRIVRLTKWDVKNRRRHATPREQAIRETIQYRDYILDRLKAVEALGIPILSYTEIRLEEEDPGYAPFPVFFFDRRYVPGIATDKIPPSRYARQGFVARLCRLLGTAAAVSLILGRTCPRTGRLHFDDGDEVIELDAGGLPGRLTISKTTGSFTDWGTPVAILFRDCLEHLAGHLGRAREKGIQPPELKAAVDAFGEALSEEISRMQQRLQDPSSRLRLLFADRTSEHGGIRMKWESMLSRLEATDTKALLRLIRENPELSSFVP